MSKVREFLKFKWGRGSIHRIALDEFLDPIEEDLSTLTGYWSNPRITIGTSFNDMTISGTYVVNKTMINSPITGPVYGIIKVVATKEGWLFHDLWLVGDNRRFRRTRASSGFTTWKEY